jgi:broad specificity phosphatase PhoE
MRVFLVRHAESKANALNVHSSKEEELSDNGIRQAETVARRFVGMDIGVILCSRYRRAMQTANIIKDAVGKKIVYTDLLGEWRMPSEVRGKRHDSKEGSGIWDTLYKNADDPKWHYSDEENVMDVLSRAKKLLRYIRSRKEESLIVVTHGAFIGVLLATCLFGEGITGSDMRKTAGFFRAMNTGITELHMDKEKGIRLMTFNDYAHLK